MAWIILEFWPLIVAAVSIVVVAWLLILKGIRRRADGKPIVPFLAPPGPPVYRAASRRARVQQSVKPWARTTQIRPGLFARLMKREDIKNV